MSKTYEISLPDDESVRVGNINEVRITKNGELVLIRDTGKAVRMVAAFAPGYWVYFRMVNK